MVRPADGTDDARLDAFQAQVINDHLHLGNITAMIAELRQGSRSP